MRHQREVLRQQFEYNITADPNSAGAKTWGCLMKSLKWSREHLQMLLLSDLWYAGLYIVIIINYIALGFMIPLYKGRVIYDVGYGIIFTVNLLLTIEIVMRVIAWGFIIPVEAEPGKPVPKKPFFRTWSGYIDLAICIVTWVELQNSWISLVRMFRLFRPGEGDQLPILRKFRFLFTVIIVALPGMLLWAVMYLFYAMWWAIYGTFVIGDKMGQFCYPQGTTFEDLLSSCLPNLTQCLVDYPVLHYYIGPRYATPCGNSSLFGDSGQACVIPGTVCEDRGYNWLFDYDNVLASTASVIQILTGFEVWFKQLQASAAVSGQIWWWFVVPSLYGAHGFALLIQTAMLKAHRQVTELEKHRPQPPIESFDYAPETDAERRRQMVRDLVESHFFILFMLGVVVVSVSFLMVDWYGIPDNLVNLANYVNVACWALFLVEMFLKVFAYGRRYFYEPLNALDFALVWLQIANVALSLAGINDGTAPCWVAALAAFRGLRLLRFNEYLPVGYRSKKMAVAFIQCTPKYVLVEVLHIAFIWGFAVAGANIFDDIAKDYVRTTFNNLWQAVIAAFALSTGEYWATLLETVYSENLGSWVLFKATVYVALLLFICFYIIPALYWVVQIIHYEDCMKGIITRNTAFNEYKSTDPRNGFLRKLFEKDFAFDDFPDDDDDDAAPQIRGGPAEAQMKFRSAPPTKVGKYIVAPEKGPWENARPWLTNLVISPHYRVFNLICIVLHCVAVALMNPNSPQWLYIVAITGKILFVVLQAIQILLEWFVYGPIRWLRVGYNVMDLVIWPLSLVGIFISGFSGFVMFRLFTALHILRRGKRVQALLQAMTQQTPVIITAFILIVIMLSTFSISGVKLFKGRWYSCRICFQDVNGYYFPNNCAEAANQTAYCSQQACESANDIPIPGAQYVWYEESSNFNNVLSGMIVMIRVASNSAWSELMYLGMDSQGEAGKCMLTNVNQVNALWFLIAAITMQFITFPWFNAVMAYAISLPRLSVPVFDTLDDRQKLYVQLVLYYGNSRMCDPRNYPAPFVVRFNQQLSWKQQLRVWISHVVESKWYEPFCFLLELCYFILLTSYFSPSPEIFFIIVRVVGTAMMVFWIVDMTLKIILLGSFEAYLKTSFYLFEFCSLLADIVVFILSWVIRARTPLGLIRLMRLLHMGNMVYDSFTAERTVMYRFFDARLTTVLQALKILIPGVTSVFVIYFVVLSAIAVFAVELYYDMPIDGIVITTEINFQNWGSALIATHNMVTSDYWVQVLSLQNQGPPFCNATLNNATCSGVAEMVLPIFSPFFGLLIFALVFAIVFDTVTQLNIERRYPTAQLKWYTMTWKRLDSKQRRSMPFSRFLLLWRYLRLLHKGDKQLHVGLKEFTSKPLDPKRLAMFRQPFICWPINSNFRVYFLDGLFALICGMADVGYVEHCLLQRIMTPSSEPEMDHFYTIFHAWFVDSIAKLWRGNMEFHLERVRHLNEDVAQRIEAWKQRQVIQQMRALQGTFPADEHTADVGPTPAVSPEPDDDDDSTSTSTKEKPPETPLSPVSSVDSDYLQVDGSDESDEELRKMIQDRRAKRAKVEKEAWRIRQLKAQRGEREDQSDTESVLHLQQRWHGGDVRRRHLFRQRAEPPRETNEDTRVIVNPAVFASDSEDSSPRGPYPRLSRDLSNVHSDTDSPSMRASESSCSVISL